MKIKKGFAKRDIAGSNIVVPVGKTSLDFTGMITLNDTASFIWDCFGEDITVDEAVKKVVAEYDIDEATAKKDVDAFVARLKENSLIEE